MATRFIPSTDSMRLVGGFGSAVYRERREGWREGEGRKVEKEREGARWGEGEQGNDTTLEFNYMPAQVQQRNCSVVLNTQSVRDTRTGSPSLASCNEFACLFTCGEAKPLITSILILHNTSIIMYCL